MPQQTCQQPETQNPIRTGDNNLAIQENASTHVASIGNQIPIQQAEKIGDASNFLNRNCHIQDSMSGHQLTLRPSQFPDR